MPIGISRSSTDRCARAAGRQARVLFVDDDELMRLSCVDTIADLGHKTVAAATGRAALDYVRGGGEVDVLMTDLGLPDITGQELAARIRALRPRIRVIYATGYDESRAMNGAYPHTWFLAKPFAPDALARALRLALADREG